jgi:hypothetical protein
LILPNGEIRMNALEQQNLLLIAEADRILNEFGLLKILKKYGTPFVTGSYLLGLMTWRDLDIHLEMNIPDEKKFFHMGGEVASALKPWRMSYRNEFLARTLNLPLGFYFGVHTFILGGTEEWKIDIWAMDTEQMEEGKKDLAELQAGINAKSRRAILEIKNRFCKHPEYRAGLHSLDIYEAVMKHDIKTPEEFIKYMKSRNVDLTETSKQYSRVQKEGR